MIYKLNLILFSNLFVLLSGCAFFGTDHFGNLFTSVSPEEYGKILCQNLELEDYPSCVNQVLEYFDRPRSNDLPRGHSTSGPLAVVMEGKLYLGKYSSLPFVADFRVFNGNQTCRGSYNALAGSHDAIFDVSCNDGRKGWADLILASDGRNGIGKLALNDGTKGQIVFGYTALGRAESYPYRP